MSTRRMGPVTPFGHDATLIYVPGIGGCGRSDAEWTRGLRAGGYDGKIEVCDWSSRLGPLDALWDHERQRVEGRQIAICIRRLRAESPSSPIVLAAHSAGAGLVVHALEDLPPGTHVDGVVLMAPALSRTYDLTPALRHVHGRADVFCSDRDTLVLTIGTFLFGTVDGIHGEAAGHGGFVRPARSAAAEYAKLHTHRFSHARQLLGDDGGHYGPQNSSVAAILVAPLLPRSESPAARPAVASAEHARTVLLAACGAMISLWVARLPDGLAQRGHTSSQKNDPIVMTISSNQNHPPFGDGNHLPAATESSPGSRQSAKSTTTERGPAR